MHLYRLLNDTSTIFHLGKDALNDNSYIIHSDTLFSAIINCYTTIYGKQSADIFIREFRNGNIKLSSVFYFIDFLNNDLAKSIYFFPIPNLSEIGYNTSQNSDNITYISENLFKELILNYDPDTYSSKFNSDTQVFSDMFCCENLEFLKNNKADIMQIMTEYKAEFTRITSQLNFSKRYVNTSLLLNQIELDNFSLKPGMFFLADINTSFMDKFDASVRLLCDEGIGGKRSTGRGQFTKFEKLEYKYDKDFFNSARIKINLSLISPTGNDLKDLKNNFIRYSSVLRGGWTPNNIKTKNLRMVKEGSIFKTKLQGRLVNITPLNFKEHKIFRNGVGFFL